MRKKSIWSEFTLLSGGMLAGILAVIALCTGLYFYMIRVPKKVIKLDDSAKIFSSEEEKELKDVMEDIRDKKHINVVIVTTDDKGRGYGNSDEECARFAGDYYRSHAITSNFRDNSGICILVDLTCDYDGGRFFWLYTYGTAFYAISDDDCSDLFRSHKSELQAGEYYEAVDGILDDIEDDFDFTGGGVAFMNGLVAVIPLVIAAIATALVTTGRSLDKAPRSNRYKASVTDKGDEDIFIKKTVVETVNSGGGGGGFSGGGGGGFSGGHSGGGGGRF